MKLYALLTITVLLLPLTSATAPIQVYDLYCNELGEFGFKVLPTDYFGEATDLTALLKAPGSSRFNVIDGSFDKDFVMYDEQVTLRSAEYASKEAEIKKPGEYELELSYTLNDGERERQNILFQCDGAEFSCRMFDIEVKECYSTNGTFYADFVLDGLDNNQEYPNLPQYTLDDYEFLITTDGRYCDVEGNCARSAGLPYDSVLKKISGENYRLTWDYEAKVKGFSVKFLPGASCIGKQKDYEFRVNHFIECDPDPYAKEYVCDGCETGTVCIPEGTKVVKEGVSLFCVDGELTPQLPTGASCNTDVECFTGFCKENVCVDEILPSCPKGELKESCNCGSTEVIDWQNKFCCDNELSNQKCVTPGETITECSEGFELINGECQKMVEEEPGFWSQVWSFFRGLFSRR